MKTSRNISYMSHPQTVSVPNRQFCILCEAETGSNESEDTLVERNR